MPIRERADPGLLAMKRCRDNFARVGVIPYPGYRKVLTARG
jgi:hypothetical protein